MSERGSFHAWRDWLGLARSLTIYQRPGRQRQLRRLYRPFVAPGDTVFDVGAHVGDRTRAFHALGARVVALEPQPGIRRWLCRCTRALPNVTVRPEAVGAAPGQAALATSPGNPSIASMSAAWRTAVVTGNPGFQGVRWSREVTVPVITLDALIAQYGEPAFCKIDVEGYEPEVLAGLSGPLPALSFEFVAGSLDGARCCLTRLQTLAEYRFNVVLGEQRRFLWPEWQSAAAVDHWLVAGADSHPSGDIYARRAPDP